MTSAIPVVDLAGAATPGVRRIIAAAMTDALRRSACAWVIGHGVPDDVQQAMDDVTASFFASAVGPSVAGDEPAGARDTLALRWAPGAAGDGLVPNGSAPSGGAERPAPGRWPTLPTELRAAWAAYHEALAGVAASVVGLVADHLHLPLSELDAWTTGQCSDLVAHFERNGGTGRSAAVDTTDGSPTTGRPRRANGGVTVRTFDDASGAGLEVRQAGRWVSTDPLPGALFVQSGELLERWTNGIVPAALLRVRPPSGGDECRRSVALHHHPRLDAVIAPAPSCAGDGGPRFAPVRCGAFAYGAGSAGGDGSPSARTVSMVSASSLPLSAR